MYVKVFSSMMQSSIWTEPATTFKVWMTLLLAMDQEGYAHFAGIKNLANAADVTVEEAQVAVDCFLAPDPNSSNPACDGKRVEKVPGGFIVLNAKAYRSIKDREMEREKTKLRTRKYRERKKCDGVNVTESSHDVTTPSPSVSVSASVSVFKGKGKRENHKGNSETVFSQSEYFEFSKFRSGLSAWSEEKCRYWYEEFINSEKMKPGKYKYADWCAAARAWNKREPFKEPEQSKKAIKSMKEIWATKDES